MRWVLVVLAGLLTGVVLSGCSRGSRGPGDSAATAGGEASPARYAVQASVGEGADESVSFEFAESDVLSRGGDLQQA